MMAVERCQGRGFVGLLNKVCVAMGGRGSTWMAFGGNTRDLGSFREETDKTTDLCSYLGQISNLVRGPRSEISIIS
ncbi:hypothetical protein Tco_0420290, partial [Tanacetum coccineum]